LLEASGHSLGHPSLAADQEYLSAVRGAKHATHFGEAVRDPSSMSGCSAVEESDLYPRDVKAPSKAFAARAESSLVSGLVMEIELGTV
jgi:hypothetical protein